MVAYFFTVRNRIRENRRQNRENGGPAYRRSGRRMIFFDEVKKIGLTGRKRNGILTERLKGETRKGGFLTPVRRGKRAEKRWRKAPKRS